MSARVAVNAWGQWVAYCQPCNETTTGSMASVDLWADVHNNDNHAQDTP
jgi:hypothetical protein